MPANRQHYHVAYTSPGVGYYGGNVTFARSNHSDESQIAFPVVAVSGLSKFSLTLAGTAFEGGEAEVDFGYLPLGNAVSQSFVIHNSGSAALTIGTITLPTGFVLTQSPAASVAPGQTTSLTIGTASPAAIEYSGSVTIMTNDPVAGPFTFDVGSHAVDLTQFSLYSDSGVSQTDGISEDPRVSEIVSGGPSEGTKIEIDDTGDGVPDREFTPDEDGRFAFVPVGYQSGEFTVAARLCVPNEATGTNLTSSWDSLSAEYDPEAGNATPEIASVDLLNDTGTSNSDNQTWDPTIQGQVSNDGVIRDLAVEFDVNDDDVRDYTAYTNDTGVFTYRPLLSAGTKTIQVRTLELNFDGSVEVGEWTPFSFVLQAMPPPVIASIGLKNDTGTNSTDKSTIDPTLQGTITTEVPSTPSSPNLTTMVTTNRMVRRCRMSTAALHTSRQT